MKTEFIRVLSQIFSSLEMGVIFFSSYVPSNAFRKLILRAWGAKIGKGCAINHGLHVRSARKLQIGDDCYLAEGLVLDARGGLTIGPHTSINSSAQIWSAQHDVMSPTFAYVSAPVKIGRRAWISSNTTVLPGVNIGDGTVLAAGGVAAKDLPSWSLCGGVPAKRIADRPVVDEYRLDAAKNKVWWW